MTNNEDNLTYEIKYLYPRLNEDGRLQQVTGYVLLNKHIYIENNYYDRQDIENFDEEGNHDYQSKEFDKLINQSKYVVYATELDPNYTLMPGNGYVCYNNCSNNDCECRKLSTQIDDDFVQVYILSITLRE